MIILITLLWIFISFLTLISYFPAVPHYSSCREGGCSQTSVSFPVPQLGYGLLSSTALVQSSLLLQMLVTIMPMLIQCTSGCRPIGVCHSI